MDIEKKRSHRPLDHHPLVFATSNLSTFHTKRVNQDKLLAFSFCPQVDTRFDTLQDCKSSTHVHQDKQQANSYELN
jgi:hypothetical protein